MIVNANSIDPTSAWHLQSNSEDASTRARRIPYKDEITHKISTITLEREFSGHHLTNQNISEHKEKNYLKE